MNATSLASPRNHRFDGGKLERARPLCDAIRYQTRAQRLIMQMIRGKVCGTAARVAIQLSVEGYLRD
jgi:hypothetical protein